MNPGTFHGQRRTTIGWARRRLVPASVFNLRLFVLTEVVQRFRVLSNIVPFVFVCKTATPKLDIPTLAFAAFFTILSGFPYQTLYLAH